MPKDFLGRLVEKIPLLILYRLHLVPEESMPSKTESAQNLSEGKGGP